MKKYLILLSILFLSLNLSASAHIMKSNGKILQAIEAESYQWYFNGEKINGANNQELITMSNGLYSVLIKNADGTFQKETVLFQAKAQKIQRIHLVGDSTMADYSLRSDYMTNNYPVTGWGQVFQMFMAADSLQKVDNFIDADSIEVIDWAIGGRSTRLFYEEGTWQKVYNAIQPGDYVMIQFGHNDASEAHPDRYVDTAGFKMYLKMFAEQTREKGGIPVFITPVNRNYPWSGGVLTSVHGNYPLAMEQAADDSKTALIDLTTRSCEFFTTKGQDYVTSHYFMTFGPGVWEGPYWETGSNDGTHFQPDGAIEVARLVYEGISDLRKLTITKTDEAAGEINGSRWHDTKYTENLSIEAYSNRGWVFENWTGDIESNENPLILDFKENLNIHANYRQTNKAQYEVSAIHEGQGAVSIQPFGGLYEEGSSVTLTALPDDKYELYAWTGNEVSSSNPYNYTVKGNTTVNAVFTKEANVIYQPENAVLSNCDLIKGEFNQTGTSCIKPKQGVDTCSIDWKVYPEEEGRVSIYFRYKNNSDTAILANFYINGELEEEGFEFKVSEEESGWETVRISSFRFDPVNNEISLRFNNLQEDIYIDYIELNSRMNLLDPYTAVNRYDENLPWVKIYPNPVNKHSTINFNLDKKAMTLIEVFSINGSKKSTLYNGLMEKGRHEISLNSENLLPGMYVCKVQKAGDVSSIKFAIE